MGTIARVALFIAAVFGIGVLAVMQTPRLESAKRPSAR